MKYIFINATICRSIKFFLKKNQKIRPQKMDYQPGQMYVPRRKLCQQAVMSGGLMGGGTGMVIGILSGTMQCIGQGFTKREALRTIGRTSFISAGSFAVFMGVGQALRSGKCF